MIMNIRSLFAKKKSPSKTSLQKISFLQWRLEGREEEWEEGREKGREEGRERGRGKEREGERGGGREGGRKGGKDPCCCGNRLAKRAHSAPDLHTHILCICV